MRDVRRRKMQDFIVDMGRLYSSIQSSTRASRDLDFVSSLNSDKALQTEVIEEENVVSMTRPS